jgi:hypothetical protein
MQLHVRPVRLVPFGDDGDQWAERCSVLRANPAAVVYVRTGDVLHHACSAMLSAELTFDDAGPVHPGVAFCVNCRRIGVLWEIQWLAPEDLRVRIDAAVLAFDAWLDDERGSR